VVRGLARRLIGVTFVVSGVEALRDGDNRARKVNRAAAGLGISDPQAASRAIAGAQLGAGVLLLLGRFPRLASLVLALTVIPDAATAHAFWSADDKQDREAERRLFVRDLGLLGGALVSAVDTGGRESIAHRARRSAKSAKSSAAKRLP
jgi:uncharacterized membrane protein YphA (DoxX/SURF4 family)